MYDIVFCRTSNGRSELIELLDELQVRAETSKDARTVRQKLLSYLGSLTKFGTRVGEPAVKHVVDDIWELRPHDLRVFFFLWKGSAYVLLNHYWKKDRKAPRREIVRARRLRRDYLERFGA